MVDESARSGRDICVKDLRRGMKREEGKRKGTGS
jgi:hypothetical protein